MIDNTTEPNQRIVCVVLCESDPSNAYALGLALRWQRTCDHFVIVGKSEFIADYFQSPFGFNAEFVDAFDSSHHDVMLFDASTLAANKDASESIEKAFTSMSSVVKRVRELRQESQKT